MTDEKLKEEQEDLQPAEEAEPSFPDVEDATTLKKLLDEERAKSAEYLDNWRRAAADFSNYRKRSEKDSSEFTKLSNAVLIARMLPVLDDFDRAFQTIPDKLRGLTWIDGIALIQRKMHALMENEGLKAIEAVDKPFDPNYHEAVIHEESDQVEEGTVIGELQKGFMLGERVLRPTLVKVAKKKDSNQ